MATLSVRGDAKLSLSPFPAGGLPCLRFPRFYRGHTPATLMERKNKMRFVASRCRMSKRFSQEAGSGADPGIPTPRREKNFAGYSLQVGDPFRMQREQHGHCMDTRF